MKILLSILTIISLASCVKDNDHRYFIDVSTTCKRYSIEYWVDGVNMGITPYFYSDGNTATTYSSQHIEVMAPDGAQIRTVVTTNWGSGSTTVKILEYQTVRAVETKQGGSVTIDITGG